MVQLPAYSKQTFFRYHIQKLAQICVHVQESAAGVTRIRLTTLGCEQGWR